MKSWRLFAVGSLLLLTGCTGLVPLTDSTTVVAVESAEITQSEATIITNESVVFWQAQADDGTGPITVDPDTTSPDIVVRYQPTITECNGETTEELFSYCWVPGDPGRLTVATAYTDEGTLTVAKHGIGTMLGFDPAAAETLRPTTELEYDDPWPGHGPTTVRVNNTVNDRAVTPLVEQSLQYWNRRDEEYATYTTNFTLGPETETADVEVRIVEEIDSCDRTDIDLLGCAPIYSAETLATERTVVRILAGYTNETTLRTLKHEFGHVLGIRHGEAPTELMNGTDPSATQLPQPDASERDNPWGRETLTVSIDQESFAADEQQVRRQVQYALTYYGEENDRTAETVDFELRSPGTAADVMVVGGETRCMDGDSGSCWVTRGADVDPDDALETYTNQTIHVEDVDVEALGWHVGHALGYTVTGAESDDQLPEPFRNADYEQRRNWYE